MPTDSIAHDNISRKERDLLLAIAETALPAGNSFPAADEQTIDRVATLLSQLHRITRVSYKSALRALDASALVRHRRSFIHLDPPRRLATLESWRHGGTSRRLALRALMAPIKAVHFDNPAFFRAIGCVYEFNQTGEPIPRYMSQRAHDCGMLEEHTQLECDVVIIGSGAGGAVVAKELAELGHAVIILEEGNYFRRKDFTGRAMDMQRKLYRNAGATVAVGNTVIPIPLGQTVGGTTTVNSGTCYRVPDRVLSHWQQAFGLTDITTDNMARYFDRVERILGVASAQPAYLGGVARVIARGCDKLGYAHAPLRRNAPDCDGKGVCCFGCPTDAKRSTNVSYIPMALREGAELFYRTRVTRILTAHGRAVGVVAEAPTDNHSSPNLLTVRSRAVVVACGAIMTPVLLRESGLCRHSPALGDNLTIHPAVASMALFNEDISAFNSIPQGYTIEEFHNEGLLFEGATTPLDIGMAAVPFLGSKLIELAENYARVAAFGFLVEDSSCGRVSVVRGQPIIRYHVGKRDVARLKRGIEILANVFLAAGAKAIHPMVHGFDTLQSQSDITRLRRAKLRATDFDLTAYHPLGTARMGTDPRSSVIGPTHETHEVPSLYITDASAIPSSLAVNPQMTIMALATRAAEHIHKALQ